jgi:hypothetical protein
MGKLIYLSFATAALAFAVAETRLFKPVRDLAQRINPLVGELFSCGYCLGFWVALGFAALTGVKLFDTWWLLDYFMTALAVAWLAAWQWALMCWAMDKVGK